MRRPVSRSLLRTLVFVSLCVGVAVVALVTLTATRLEMRPGALFYWVLVPQEWREAAVQPFAQPERYESVPADGPSEAVLRIDVVAPRPQAFARHMAAQGYMREMHSGQPSSWSSWAGPKGMVQTDLESPCANESPCRRTIVVLAGARP